MIDKKELTTYKHIEQYDLRNLQEEAPYVRNHSIGYRKYAITIELIDEPNDVLCERLEHLWVSSTNHHDSDVLRSEAKKLGYKFKGEFGSKKPTNMWAEMAKNRGGRC